MLSNNYKEKVKKAIFKRFTEMGIDDEDTLNELNDESINSLENELLQIETILESNDISELGFHTHTIKGVLLNAGLNNDAENFREIKHLFEDGKSDEEIKNITKERISIFYKG
jgi:HPt (histidine-containing phosphotransfer) domain-containing protein